MFVVGACLTRQLPIDDESEVLDRQRPAVDTRLLARIVLEGVPGHPPVAFAFRLHAVLQSLERSIESKVFPECRQMQPHRPFESDTSLSDPDREGRECTPSLRPRHPRW